MKSSTAWVLHVEQNGNKERNMNFAQEASMIRLARDSMALASVAGFVWMVCSVAHLVG